MGRVVFSSVRLNGSCLLMVDFEARRGILSDINRAFKVPHPLSSLPNTGMEDDEVVKEIDVFLTKELQDKLWLLQYPVRPADSTYNGELFLSTQVKPQQKKIKLELSLDTSAPTYSTGKGEHLAMSVDGPAPKDPPNYPSGKLDKIELTSSLGGSRLTGQYAVASVTSGQVHLTPLSTILQVRPDLTFLDNAEQASKARAQRLLDVADGDSSQDDEEEEVKAVKVKFARQETAEQKSRRIQSYDYLQKKQNEEPWVNCTYMKIQSEHSGRIRHQLRAVSQEPFEAYCNGSEYLANLVPKTDHNPEENPDMPSDVLSMTQLKCMPLNDRIRTVIMNAKVIQWSQIQSLLDPEDDHSSVVKSLQQVAVLVQGCWVVKSDVLYPKDSFSAYNLSPAEVICKARDFLLWKFTQSRSIIRRDITNVVKIPPDEMKEMLEQVAKPKAKQGWVFKCDFDHSFVEKNKEVVQRQQMLWDVKYQQLSKHFKLPKDVKQNEATKRRRRHSSRSKSRSEFSDTDGERNPGDGERTPGAADSKTTFSFNNHKDNNGDVPMEAMTAPITAAAILDSDELMKELCSLMRDKLLALNVMSMTKIRDCYHTKLAQCSPGHVLGMGISDSLLEKAVLLSGATKVNIQSMGPPGSGAIFYMLTKAGDDLDELRSVIAELFQNNRSIVLSNLKDELQRRSIEYSESQCRQLMKLYCVTKGNRWFLKGSESLEAKS